MEGLYGFHAFRSSRTIECHISHSCHHVPLWTTVEFLKLVYESRSGREGDNIRMSSWGPMPALRHCWVNPIDTTV